ncbi:hypothetical protein LCGC14_2278940, partial [marine sediment metagenome]
AAGYKDFTLDANGRAHIDGAAITGFSARTSFDFLVSAPPVDSDETFDIRTADFAGTTNDPKLVITFEPAPTASGFFSLLS